MASMSSHRVPEASLKRLHRAVERVAALRTGGAAERVVGVAQLLDEALDDRRLGPLRAGDVVELGEAVSLNLGELGARRPLRSVELLTHRGPRTLHYGRDDRGRLLH